MRGSVKILALSVFSILFVRVRRPSRLLKIVFPLLLPSVRSLRLRVSRSTSCSTFHTHYVLVTVSRIVRQVNTVRSLRLRLQSHVSCTSWISPTLVIKISWPTSGRVPETTFLQKAAEEAEKSDGKWAVKHLPRVYFAKDADFGKYSTFAMVERLFKDAKFAGGDFVYERRDLRIIIQEELYPLKSLTNARDMGQVFVDIACSM